MEKNITPVGSGELVEKGSLTFEEHVSKIQSIQTQIKRNIFELANAVSDAYDQLDSSSVSALAQQLGMGRSTLYQWKAISESKFLNQYQHLLPDVFSSLYSIVTLEGKVRAVSSSDSETYERLATFVDEGRFFQEMSNGHVRELISEVDYELKRRINSDRAITKRDVVADTALATGGNTDTLANFLEKKVVFKTFLISPSFDVLKKYASGGFTEEDIHIDLPVTDLRDITTDGSILCALLVPNRYLPTGLMMMNAWGFAYSDIHARPDKHQLLIGWRGASQQVSINSFTPIAEQLQILGSPPFLSVWGKETNLNDWSHVL